MVLRVPTSIILADLLRDAPSDHVTLEWIVDRLGERSFGIVMLVIALLGLVPVVLHSVEQLGIGSDVDVRYWLRVLTNSC